MDTETQNIIAISIAAITMNNSFKLIALNEIRNDTDRKILEQLIELNKKLDLKKGTDYEHGDNSDL